MGANDTGRRWLWVDLETTGLGYDPALPQEHADDVILEVAAIITGSELEEVSSFGPHSIAASGEQLGLMGAFVREMHTRTGLLERVMSSAACPIAQVDGAMSAWMGRHGLTERVILAGSSVKLDFEFIRRHMPLVFTRLGYRVIDVSSFKEALRDWLPGVVADVERVKASSHEAMNDIRWSVRELRHYRQELGLGHSPAGQQAVP